MGPYSSIKNYKARLLTGVSGMRGHLVKAVTLDLWETLLLEREGDSKQRNMMRCDSLSRALKEIGLHISNRQFALALKEMSAWLASFWEVEKEVTHSDQIRFLIKSASGGSILMKDEWFERLSSAYVSPFFELPPHLNPETSELLRWLKKRDKRIGLISNVGMTPGFALRRFLGGQRVGRYFDSMIFSDEVGLRKPNPAIFHLASHRLGARPDEVVHIGDDLRSDIWGAKKAGFKAIYLSTDIGRNKTAERDPTSLVSVWRRVSGKLAEGDATPDRTITTLRMAIEMIDQLDT